MTFELLPDAMVKLRERIEDEVNIATQKVVLVIVHTAAENTPVDTSKAMSNWRVGIGSGPEGEVGARVPGKGGSSGPAVLYIIGEDAKRAMQNRKVGTAVHIVNNAEHIEKLNNGTGFSKPPGFVEKAELMGSLQIKNTQIRLQ